MSTRPIRKFDETIGLLNRGRFAETCDEHLQHALEMLSSLPSEKGTATITVTLAINYDSGRVDIKPAVKSKLPEGQAFSGTPFWVHESGLSTQHPSQHDLFPRAVDDRANSRSAFKD